MENDDNDSDDNDSYDNIQVAMVENANVVLVWIIFDLSREDRNVFNKQVVWSDNFRDGHRVLQLLEEKSIQLRAEEFDLHLHLQERFIPLHGTYYIATVMESTYMCPIVVILDQSVSTLDGDGDILICIICYDALLSGYEATKFPCNHLFHQECILEWFYVKLECPICRNEIL